MKSEMIKALDQFLGQECWSCVAGSGTGSIFSLNFGNRIPRAEALKNPHLTEEERNFDSEISIMVWSSWKLEHQGNAICDSGSDNSNDGPLVLGLNQLKGKKIDTIHAETPTDQIGLLFEGGFDLKIFCDGFQTYGGDSENFIIFLPDAIYSVTTNGNIEKEGRPHR